MPRALQRLSDGEHKIHLVTFICDARDRSVADYLGGIKAGYKKTTGRYDIEGHIEGEPFRMLVVHDGVSYVAVGARTSAAAKSAADDFMNRTGSREVDDPVILQTLTELNVKAWKLQKGKSAFHHN